MGEAPSYQQIPIELGSIKVGQLFFHANHETEAVPSVYVCKSTKSSQNGKHGGLNVSCVGKPVYTNDTSAYVLTGPSSKRAYQPEVVTKDFVFCDWEEVDGEPAPYIQGFDDAGVMYELRIQKADEKTFAHFETRYDQQMIITASSYGFDWWVERVKVDTQN